jgi:membrane peptidoglycan carboxypeptidase
MRKSSAGRTRPRWARILRRVGAWGLTIGLVLATIAVVGMSIVYARIQIPGPSEFAQAQSSIFYYADGTTEMGRIGLANRESVSITDLPDYVPNSIVAAEDRTFYSNPGIDFLGTGRALFKTVVLGHKQGGSSITQQYVERYYFGQTTTDLVGKTKEALLALKIDQQQDKDRILENYMNTIYFGRGAYGIQAAAREYFNVNAADLTVSQAALLAGIIPAPSAWDPRVNPVQAEARWNYVLDGMVAQGWPTPSDRLRLEFPETAEYRKDNTFGGPQGYLLREAIVEISAKTGLSQDAVETGGYTIVTSIDWATQQAAQNAAATLPEDHSPNLRLAIVTLDPTTGAITSMYGGADYVAIQRNAVTQDIAQAGSTFKPFALIAALEKGIALESVYSGASPQAIAGFSKPVKNFGNENFGNITLTTATEHSVNTVYAQLARDVGPDTVMDVAVRAGLPEDTSGLEANPANVLGTASPHPLDMASAYATIAAQGVRHDPFLVATVTDAAGEVVYAHEVAEERVFGEAVMADTTYALQQVVLHGSGGYAANLGRPIAGKTGTSSDNKSAWFIGFTPQIVGAVAVYQVGADGSVEAITPFGGFKQITGGSVPCRIWTAMMGEVLPNLPVEQFPPRSHVGTAIIPSPSPSPVVTPSPTPTPSATPTSGGGVSPSPSLSPSP